MDNVEAIENNEQDENPIKDLIKLIKFLEKL